MIDYLCYFSYLANRSFDCSFVSNLKQNFVNEDIVKAKLVLNRKKEK